DSCFCTLRKLAIPDPIMTKKSQPKNNAAQTERSVSTYGITDAQAFGRNMAKVADRSQRLISEFVRRQSEHFGHESLDPLNITSAWFALLKQMAANPARLLNAQLELWHDYMNLLQHSAERAMGRKNPPVVTPAAGDRRFRDPDW